MESVKGFEFLNYFSKVPIVNNQFLKVIAIDEIPKVIPVKHFVIVNLSPKHLSGSHWIVLIRSERNCLEIFNSLGGDTYNTIKNYFNFTAKLVIHTNETAFQSSTSSTCGYFCIYFAVNRILNLDMSFDHLLEHIFSDNIDINETNVVEFCNNLLIDGNENLLFFENI